MLNAFKDYLTKTAHVKAKYIPYYLKWVSDCYAFFDLPNSQPIGNDKRKEFLRHISRSHEDWQVKQADTAIRLYDYFLSMKQRESQESFSDMSEGWKLLEEKTREALRVRQRAYNTEKNLHRMVTKF